jgi:Tfp pilus assembly protein PilO
VTARLASLSDGKKVALTAGALFLVVILGYFVLIAPKRAHAASLKKQAAAVQKQIDSNKSTAFMQALPAVRSASVFGLAKAMPKQVEMPNVILQLSSLAGASGITFDQVTPTPTDAATSAVPTAATTDPFAAQPIQVTFTGTFYNLISFLQRVRNLVRVENGRLQAAGRLFDVSDVEFCALNAKTPSCITQPPDKISLPAPAGSGSGFIHVTLTINALVPQPPATTTPGSTDTTSTTTGTTTTGTTTTTSNPTSAAPSTSGGTS